MKTFEYNWAMAEIMKIYLKNSHAQEAQKARATTDISNDTQEVPVATDPGLTTANDNAGAAGLDSNSLDSD